jgi:integrase
MSKLKKFKDRKGNSTAHLYRDEITLIFYAVLRIGAKVEKQSLDTDEHLEALRRLPQALTNLGKPKTEREKLKAPNKLLKDYWADLRADKVAKETRASTLEKIDRTWKNHMAPYLGNWRPDQINKAFPTNYILWHRKEFKSQQLSNPYKYIGNLFNFMLKAGAITPEQMPELEIPKSEKRHIAKKKGRVITEEERKALRKHGHDRIKLIVALGDVLGMRKMEIGALDKERLVFESGRYMIHLTEDDTKTGMPRILGVPKHLVPLLEKQMEKSGGSKFLFPTRNGVRHMHAQNIDDDWRKVKAAAEIKGRLRFHDLRHSRATEFARNDINPAIACTILGMSLRMYQKVYLNLSGSDLLKTIDAIESGSK